MAKREEIKKVINRVFNSIGFVVLMGMVIAIKTFFFYHNTIALDETIGIDTIFGSLCFIVAILCLFCTLPNRIRGVMVIVIDVLVSLLLFSDHVYYIFSNSVLSVAQITNLQYGDEIVSTLPMVMQAKQIIYFLDILIIIALCLGKIVKIEKTKRATKKQIIARTITGIVGISIFCFIGINYIEKGVQNSYNKDLQIRKATIFGYHISDIKNTFMEKKQTKYKNYHEMIHDYNQLKEKYQEQYGQSEASLQGTLENKNIVILQLESVQEFVINKEINGKPITPNLNEFLNQNIEITNMHMQSYSTTADSEHSTITSLYPMENGMSFSRYFTNNYDDIFKIFNQKNYHTSYMHGNYPYFWNRGNVYGRLNLDELVFKEQFENLSENINGDLSDVLFYQQVVEKWKNQEKPFFSYIVTASSHTPFTLDGLQDRSKINIDVGEYKDTYFGNYLEAMNYADYAFGVWIESLKEAELYEDMAILVFGDHNGLNMYNEELMDFLGYKDLEEAKIPLKLNYTRVVCGLKIPTIEKMKIEKPINKLDIKPTLAYLCNLQDTFSLGSNIFTKKDFICLNNERIITNDYYYDENWYDRKTGKELNFNNLDEETKKLLSEYEQNMKLELAISQSVSIHNLLK